MAKLGVALAITVGVLVIASIAAFILPTILAPKPEVQRIKFGAAVFDYSLSGPILVGLEKQILRKHGLEIEHVAFRGGPDLVKAIIAGDVQIGSVSIDVFTAIAQGAPIKIIAVQLPHNQLDILAAPTVRSLEDLRGKRISVTRPGALTHNLAILFAEKMGWNPEKDITIVPLGGFDAQVAALKRRETEAMIWTTAGISFPLVSKGELNVLASFKEITPKFYGQMYVASSDFLQKNPIATKTFLRAALESARFIRENPEESIKIIMKNFNMDEATARYSQQHIEWSLDGRIDPDVLRSMLDMTLRFKTVEKAIPVDQLYTSAYIP